MKKIVLIITVFVSVFFISTSAKAQSNLTTIDFKIKNIGVFVDGNFSNITVTSNFDTHNLENSFMNATVQINSINTNNKKRDKHLLESSYFDESNYKQMKLVSTKIEQVSTNEYKLTGKLTIKKTTKTVVIPLTISDSEKAITVKGNFKLNRRDYGVGGNSWVMSKEVKIQVKHTIKK